MTEQASPWSEHAYLDAYGQEAAPQHAFRAGLESLADGDYEFVIVAAALGTAANGDHILTLQLRTSGEGREVDHVYWLNRQQAVNALLADLQALSFPARTWGGRPGQTPLSVSIPGAVGRLPGVRFRARKTHRPDKKQPGQVYHDLHVLGAVKPAAPTTQQAPAVMTQVGPTPPQGSVLPPSLAEVAARDRAPVREPLAREAAQQQQEAPVYADESDIPF